MRVAILGNSGSGKSTLAHRLAGSVPVLDLDTVFWEPGQIAVRRPVEAALADVRAFCGAGEDWVVEGCYGGLVAATLPYAPVLVVLDPGVEQCLANCRARPWEPHKYPSKAAQDEKLPFLLQWVEGYYTRDDDLSLAAHRALFERYDGPKQWLSALPGPDFTLARRTTS